MGCVIKFSEIGVGGGNVTDQNGDHKMEVLPYK